MKSLPPSLLSPRITHKCPLEHVCVFTDKPGFVLFRARFKPTPVRCPVTHKGSGLATECPPCPGRDLGLPKASVLCPSSLSPLQLCLFSSWLRACLARPGLQQNLGASPGPCLVMAEGLQQAMGGPFIPAWHPFYYLSWWQPSIGEELMQRLEATVSTGVWRCLSL